MDDAKLNNLAVGVAVALTSLLSELETAEKHVGELPVDVGLVLRAPSVKNNAFGVPLAG